MRAVFGLVLLVGIALAGGAVWLAMGYVEEQRIQQAQAQAALQAVVPTVEVYAAARTLEYGEELTEEDVIVIRYPEEHMPEGVFLTAEEMFPPDADAPRIVLRTIEANEVLMESKVTGPGEVAGLNQILRPGYRAFSINVDVTSGVGGFLRPGNNVDVYWTGSVSDGREFTRLIQATVKIIAVDQNSSGASTSNTVARTVTVEVSPDQVAALTQAQATGRLTLSLVGLQDDSVAGAIEVDTNTLLGIEAQAPEIVEAPVQEEVCTTVIRRGAERIVTEIPCR